MISMVLHSRERRRQLQAAIDTKAHFDEWEESCVPSYVHPNPAAALVSWLRLFAAARMAEKGIERLGRVLDFGSSVGELSHILQHDGDYEFVELHDASAKYLLANNPRAKRVTLDDAREGEYDAVFAIDSLEHNEDYAELVGRLARLLRPEGVLVLSGPTENALYRFGRRIAGFTGEYHHTTIYDIERAAMRSLSLERVKTVPFGLPLFRVTLWRNRANLG